MEDRPRPETAIDLTETERSALFSAGARVLKLRGTAVNPDPNTTYFNEEGQEYRPDPYLEATIPSDELAGCRLPYDGLVLQSKELEFDDDGPSLMALVASRMAIRTVAHTDSQAVTVVGHEEQRVLLSREPELGIVIEDEDGEATLYRDTDTTDTLVVNPGLDDEHTVTMKGAETYVDEVAPLSRSDLIELTGGLEKLL